MKCFVVLGLSNGGLFMARQLKKQWPESLIYGIGNPKTDVGCCSRTLTCFFAVSNAEDTYQKLEHLSQAEKDIEVFICSNVMLEWMTAGPADLISRLHFQNNIDIYRIFAEKKRTASLFTELGINVPKEFNLVEEKFEDIDYPIIVKPSEKMTTIGLSKCTFIESPQRLNTYLHRVDSLGISREKLVCQQCILGDNRWEYGYGGYFENGKPLVDICFHQFRQIPQGLCCYIREISDESLCRNIKALVTPILESTHFNGFIEFDVKQDEQSKLLYVLDVNPRPWKSSDMLTLKLGDSTIFEPYLVDKKVIWRQPYLELKSGKNPHNASYSVCRQITGTKGYRTHVTLFDFHDRQPFNKQQILNIKDLFRFLFG